MMQASAVQTTARWSNPPYGGMRYDDQAKTFAEKAFAEGRSVPIPPDATALRLCHRLHRAGLQRRLMVVTDDYVVLADYLKGETEHTFESLFQMKRFSGARSRRQEAGAPHRPVEPRPGRQRAVRDRLRLV